MCGIGGVMTSDGKAPSADVLGDLIRALGHRGPDGDGRYVSGDVGLAHTRLAIIDLEHGDQPLYHPDGTVLIANAEIYNFIELRKEFGEDAFETHSDCETILKLYDRDGLGFTESLRGMYAIALYDPSNQRLILSRDPFGIKPLYYAESEAGIAFASEAQALVAAGLVSARRRVNRAVELVQLQFTTGRETIFEGINRVLPGETLVIERGRIIRRNRLRALPEGGVESWSEERALKELDKALMDSVNVHQRSDVPYGLFLSGGIDSAAVLACMAELNDQPVRAYTAGFSGTAVSDERERARVLADAVGAEHVEVDVTEDDFWARLPEIAAAMDDPAADYAIIPTYMLASEAAKDLKVILCGEGGDELLAGYGRYRSVLRPMWLGGRAMRAKGFMDGLGILREESPAWRDGIIAVQSRLQDTQATRLQTAQAVDCADWLPHDLLTKLDRCLMAHSLEGRTPFLDPVVARAAYRLDDKLKIQRNQGKYLLRKWLDGKLPAAEAFAKKRGFTVPVGEWIARRADALGPLVAASPGVDEICRPDRVRSLFKKLHKTPQKREGNAAWMLLFYALWHRRHILGARPEGGVFDTLASKV